MTKKKTETIRLRSLEALKGALEGWDQPKRNDRIWKRGDCAIIDRGCARGSACIVIGHDGEGVKVGYFSREKLALSHTYQPSTLIPLTPGNWRHYRKSNVHMIGDKCQQRRVGHRN